MSPDFQSLLPIMAIGVVLLIIAIWLVLRTNRKTTVIDQEKGDVLDEGAARASRNQALIDAPTAVKQDIGDLSANANSDLIAAAGASADAEAGVSVAPTVGEPVPEPPTSPSGEADELTRIKGLGPKIKTLLAEQGVTRFEQIAAWSDADVERVDATLGRFSGRIERDQWVEQAKLLAADDSEGFNAKFGNN